MTVQDRTDEFLNVLKLFHSKTANSNVVSLKNTNEEERDIFNLSINQISRSIYNSYLKLENLDQICRNKSLFDDKNEEIKHFVYNIKQDVDVLNEQIKLLGENLKNNNIISLNEQEKNHRTIVIISLETHLAIISQRFKQSLETRSKNLHEIQKRKEILALQNSNKSNFTQVNNNFNPNSIIEFEQDDVKQTEQLQLSIKPYDHLEEKVKSLQNIESTIVELGDMFKQLSTYVYEQEEQIQLIDANITNAEIQVEAAHMELLKYFKNISSNRWLLIKVFAILILFFFILVVIS